MAEYTEHEITVKVRHYAPDEKKGRVPLFLRQHVGEGSLGDQQFRISQNIPNGTLIVEVEGDRLETWHLDMESFVTRVVEARNKVKEVT